MVLIIEVGWSLLQRSGGPYYGGRVVLIIEVGWSL